MIKNIRKRFKRALANFLRDELLELAKNPPTPIREVHYKRECFTMERRVELSEPRVFEANLDIVKKDFCREMLNYIEVDIEDLSTPIVPFIRQVVLRMYFYRKEQ